MKRWTQMGVALLLAVVMASAAVGCSKSKPKPTLAVTLAQNGSDLLVKIETTNYKIGKDGHLHLQMDDGPQVMPFTDLYTIPHIAQGHHKIFVELADMAHTALGVSQTAEIDIK